MKKYGIFISLAVLGIDSATAGVDGQDAGASKIVQPALAFIENRGQWPDSVQFIARPKNMTVILQRDGIVLRLRSNEGRHGTKIRMTFEGSSETVIFQGERRQAGYYNFFLGSNPSKWCRRVPAYASILYRGLYDLIDLRVREREGEAPGILEYDLLLEAGADLSHVAIRCEGIDGMEQAADGTLLLHTACGAVRLSPPQAWQQLTSGKRRRVACTYSQIDATTYGFEVLDHEPGLPLVIDPCVEWSTYLGGSYDDRCDAVALDGSDILVSGSTRSEDFPACGDNHVDDAVCLDADWNGSSDGFVARFSADGRTLLWSTFVGGLEYDLLLSMVVNTDHEIIVAGLTQSDDLPIPPGMFGAHRVGLNDGFVAKLSATGDDILYMTYIGGAANDVATNIAAYPDGAVCLTGFTMSTDFPIANRYQPDEEPPVFQPEKSGGGDNWDSFVSIINPDPGLAPIEQLVYSTYLGGLGSEGNEVDFWLRVSGRDIVADEQGVVTVVGHTNSLPASSPAAGNGFPITPDAFQSSFAGDFDGYLTRIDPQAEPEEQILYSTYLGGLHSDSAHAVALLSPSTIYVGGITWTSTEADPSFPIIPGAFQEEHGSAPDSTDGFLMIFELESAKELRYATFIGGSHFEGLADLMVRESGEVTVVGKTKSEDFPFTPDAFQKELGDPGNGQNEPAYDGYVLCINPNPDLAAQDQLTYSTFFGGAADDWFRALAEANDRDVVVAGLTSSRDFPTCGDRGVLSPQCFDHSYNGELDGFVARFDFCRVGFTRGDTNTDNTIDIADAVCVLSYLFGPAENPCKEQVPACLDAADTNDDGAIDLADGIFILQNLFANGPAIAPPYPDCGIDPTVDELDCLEYRPCE